MNNKYKNGLLALMLISVGSAHAGILDVYKDALELNGLTGTASFNYEALQAQSQQAKAALGTQFSWEVSSGINKNTTESRGLSRDTDTTKTRATVSLNQSLFDYELKSNFRAAALNEAAAQAEVSLEQLNIARNSTSAYIDFKLRSQLHLVSVEKYQQLQKELDRVRKLVAKGFVARIDEAEVLLEIERSRLQIITARKDASVAAAKLYKVTSKQYPPDRQLHSLDSVDMSLFRMQTTDALIQEAMDNNPQLQLAGLQGIAADESYRAAKAAILPKLAFVGSYSRDYSRDDIDSDVDDFSMGFQLRQDLGLLGSSQKYRAAAQKSLTRVQKQQTHAMEYNLQAELKQLFSEYEGGVKSFFTLRKLLGRSQQKVQLVQQAESMGRRTQRDVYNSIIENFSIHESLVSQYYNLLLTRIEIGYRTGSLNEDEITLLDRKLSLIE